MHLFQPASCCFGHGVPHCSTMSGFSIRWLTCVWYRTVQMNLFYERLVLSWSLYSYFPFVASVIHVPVDILFSKSRAIYKVNRLARCMVHWKVEIINHRLSATYRQILLPAAWFSTNITVIEKHADNSDNKITLVYYKYVQCTILLHVLCPISCWNAL